ncbi:SCP2 sterol-binding domain-containing protein [Haloarculaceae archaeon H-GB2-1]|nr:SCP2 sterol-binding domain-containing protein [Haloarculaceae archaeon H-GB1-1]MEA5387828.1 SCP2 sterol-binding domain-containing protein [Haloarculaceae archaeon H-GB11]MEA5409328.1 SCP2 sterol-binding domain-containing protein [Haloarculaceae archaeon H-GB2-1]
MAHRLPDDAATWAMAWRDRLDDDDAFADVADGFDAEFLFEIQPDETYDGEPVRFLVVFDDGSVPDARGADGDTDYDFALAGPYDAWKALLTDDLGIAEAVMGGPLDVDGSKLTLMSYREAFSRMVDVARRVDTEFTY